VATIAAPDTELDVLTPVVVWFEKDCVALVVPVARVVLDRMLVVF
jgi:hypothetical protein